MTPEFVQAIVAATIAAVVGGVIGWCGNYYVQHQLHRRLSRIDNLRQALYDYLNLTSDYWHNAQGDRGQRQIQEGRMIVAQRMIESEYSLLAKGNKRAKKSYADTEVTRLHLWDSATGGCFGQADWKPCPDRARSAARAVTEIIHSLE